MARTELPFKADMTQQGCDHGAQCSLRSVLPKPLFEAAQATPMLGDYLHTLPYDEIGVPEYFTRLTRDMTDLDKHNLIYPTATGGLFVHLYPDPHGSRDHYIPIEPHLTIDLGDITQRVEIKLLDWVEDIGKSENDEQKTSALNHAIDASVSLNGASNRIKVTPRQLEALRYILLREKVGFALLSPFLLDKYIEDISCSGIGHIFIEHKIFKSVQAAVVFDTEDDVDQFVIWIGEWIKKPVTVRNPIVDASLPDGSRINIVYGTDVSKRGSNFTIRKFSGVPTSVMELIDYGTMDYMMASYISFVLEEGLNMFVAGATASGKTTTLNAITTFIRPDKKIVSIEDTPELVVPHHNWIQEMTRGSAKDNTGAEVGMFDLLKAALRQRPDRIIVGEIRGEEGAIAFQAMQTGHGVLSTFHASSVEKLIQRLTGSPINIPKTYIDALDVVIIQSSVRISGKGLARRIMSINEIVGYDPTSESFSYIEAFRWNPATDTFEFPGFMNSYLMEEKIALRRGIPPFKKKVIYTELKRRAKILQRLHVDRKLKNFYDVFAVLSEAQRQGLL